GVEQNDAGDVRPSQELVLENRRRAVPAAVVDEQHFVGNAELVERRVKAIEKRLQSCLLVVDGDDDGETRVVCSDRRRRSGAQGAELWFVHLAILPAAITSAAAAHTRSTSASVIPGCRGSDTVSREMRSALGNCPSRPPYRRPRVQRCSAS